MVSCSDRQSYFHHWFQNSPPSIFYPGLFSSLSSDDGWICYRHSNDVSNPYYLTLENSKLHLSGILALLPRYFFSGLRRCCGGHLQIFSIMALLANLWQTRLWIFFWYLRLKHLSFWQKDLNFLQIIEMTIRKSRISLLLSVLFADLSQPV